MQNTWEGDDGRRRCNTEIPAQEVVFLDSARNGNGNRAKSGSNYPGNASGQDSRTTSPSSPDNRRPTPRSPIGVPLPETGPATIGLSAESHGRADSTLGKRSDQRGLWESDHLYLDLVGRDSCFEMRISRPSIAGTMAGAAYRPACWPQPCRCRRRCESSFSAAWNWPPVSRAPWSSPRMSPRPGRL